LFGCVSNFKKGESKIMKKPLMFPFVAMFLSTFSVSIAAERVTTFHSLDWDFFQNSESLDLREIPTQRGDLRYLEPCVEYNQSYPHFAQSTGGHNVFLLTNANQSIVLDPKVFKTTPFRNAEAHFFLHSRSWRDSRGTIQTKYEYREGVVPVARGEYAPFLTYTVEVGFRKHGAKILYHGQVRVNGYEKIPGSQFYGPAPETLERYAGLCSVSQYVAPADLAN
jgi:hypothetical protein